jgi:nitrogen fixation protein FixH
MKRGLQWPVGMAMILALTVGVNIWVAVVAGDDPSVTVEPDYYKKALDWDSTMAQDRRNVALGWHVDPTLSPFTPDGGALLRVRLVDATGVPISLASVRVAALYNARAADIYQATLRADTTGGYIASLPVHHRGQWELRFDVVRGADHFTSVARIEAFPAGAP